MRPVVERWLAWYDELLVEPAAGGCVGGSGGMGRRGGSSTASRRPPAGSPNGSRSWRRAFDDGHLDWPDLDVDASVDLGASSTPVSTVTRFDVVIPVPLRYPGMPAHRHWELEDGRVNFASVQAGSTDIVRILLTDFALVYGEDWFVLPLEVPVGSVVTITSMRVRDTFGVLSDVAPTVGPETNPFERPWSMYRTTAVTGEPLDLDTLFVPPTLGVKTAGPAIEEVAFFRDEMANVVWAVERTTPSPLGTPVDRYRNSQPASVARVPVDVTELGDAELVYRLATPVPSNWYPYLPRRTPAGDDITLERLPASDPDGAIATRVDGAGGRGGLARRRRRVAGVAVRPLDRRPAPAVARPPHPPRPRRRLAAAWPGTPPSNRGSPVKTGFESRSRSDSDGESSREPDGWCSPRDHRADASCWPSSVLDFDVVSADVDETPRPGERPLALVRRLALAKARAVDGDPCWRPTRSSRSTARPLGQPVDADDARRMLRRLSGRTHRVHSGVALRAGGQEAVETVTTLVTLVPLTPAMLEWYLGTGEPFGKAGAYAIQGAGGVLVEGVRGSVSNVVGLPLTTVASMLQRLCGWQPGGAG